MLFRGLVGGHVVSCMVWYLWWYTVPAGMAPKGSALLRCCWHSVVTVSLPAGLCWPTVVCSLVHLVHHEWHRRFNVAVVDIAVPSAEDEDDDGECDCPFHNHSYHFGRSQYGDFYGDDDSSDDEY